MELRHLRYFVAVAGELNFTRAARRLRVAQPALSRQIRQLESELGVTLFERGGREIRLTEAGAAFRTEAEEVLRHSESAVQVARRTADPASQPLKLGYVWGLFHAWIPPVLERFRAARPATPVHLFDLAPREQAGRILEGKLDAGLIGFGEDARVTGLARRKVGSVRYVAVLPAGHRAAKSRTVPLASLAQELFLGISESTFPGASRQMLAACRLAGFRPRILQMVERGHTILALVAGRCGVALLPESLRALPHPGVVFRPLTEPPTEDLFVAWRARRTGPELSALLESLP